MHEEYAVGINIGHTKLYTALIDLYGHIVSEVIIPTEADRGYNVVLDRLANTVDSVLTEKNVDKSQIKAVGVAIPGQIDYKHGIVRLAPNLKWHDLPIQSDITARLGLPVYIDNYANLAALGEYKYGIGAVPANKEACRSLAYISVSTGIGGGIVIDGRIVRGAGGAAGEFGHMTIDPDGRPCSCGKQGCLDAYASGLSMVRQAKELFAAGEGRLLLKMAGGNEDNVNVQMLSEAYRAGEYDSRLIINKAAMALGIAVANIIDSIDPGMIILGGGVMKIGEQFLQIILQEAKENSLNTAWRNTQIVPAYLGKRAIVLGACALAIQS